MLVLSMGTIPGTKKSHSDNFDAYQAVRRNSIDVAINHSHICMIARMGARHVDRPVRRDDCIAPRDGCCSGFDAGQDG